MLVLLAAAAAVVVVVVNMPVLSTIQSIQYYGGAKAQLRVCVHCDMVTTAAASAVSVQHTEHTHTHNTRALVKEYVT